MSDEGKGLLRLVALALVFLAIMAIGVARIRHLEKTIDELRNAPADTVTIVKTDTVKVDSPVPVHHYIKERDTAFIVLTDVKVDTVKELVFLPREYMVYKDSTYRAVVSGVQPRLDSIEVYQRNTVQTVTRTIRVPDRKRWGLGVQAGYGYDGKRLTPYVGIGVQYDILRW
jgi:hypothetical protein